MRSKINVFALLAITTILVSTACKTGNDAAGASGNSDKVSLEVKLAPGMTYKQVTKTVQNSVQTVMGMKTKTASTTEIYFRNEVLAVDAQGVADIKCTYERVKMDMDNGMAGKSSFDSDNPESEAPMQGAGYKAMVGRSIIYKMDMRGTVIGVSGVDSLFDAVMASVAPGDVKGPEMETMKGTMKSMFGDDAMKSMMQSASIMYPETPVAEGDTWSKDISNMGPMPMAMKVTYKVDHIDGEKVILSFEGDMTTDKSKALDLGIVSMEMDLTGKYSGTSEISRKTGMVLNSEVNQDMEGSMSMMGMKIPMSIDQKISVSPY